MTARSDAALTAVVVSGGHPAYAFHPPRTCSVCDAVRAGATITERPSESR